MTRQVGSRSTGFGRNFAAGVRQNCRENDTGPGLCGLFCSLARRPMAVPGPRSGIFAAEFGQVKQLLVLLLTFLGQR